MPPPPPPTPPTPPPAAVRFLTTAQSGISQEISSATMPPPPTPTAVRFIITTTAQSGISQEISSATMPPSSYSSYGGAIYNDNIGTIGDITGDFIGNYASSSDYYSGGGAIY